MESRVIVYSLGVVFLLLTLVQLFTGIFGELVILGVTITGAGFGIYDVFKFLNQELKIKAIDPHLNKPWFNKKQILRNNFNVYLPGGKFKILWYGVFWLITLTYKVIPFTTINMAILFPLWCYYSKLNQVPVHQIIEALDIFAVGCIISLVAFKK